MMDITDLERAVHNAGMTDSPEFGSLYAELKRRQAAHVAHITNEAPGGGGHNYELDVEEAYWAAVEKSRRPEDERDRDRADCDLLF